MQYFQSPTLSTAFTDICLIQPDGSAYFLAASFKFAGGTTKPSEPFPLDDVLGNENGNFVWGKKSFSLSARDVKLKGPNLFATLRNDNYHWRETSINLDKLFGANYSTNALMARDVPVELIVPKCFQEHMLTSFAFQDPETVLGTAFTDLRLIQIEGTAYFLVASYNCADGSKKPCKFPLDDVLGNEGGQFAWGKKWFSRTATNVKLEGTKLIATLKVPTDPRLTQISYGRSFDLGEHFGVHPQEKTLVALNIPVVMCTASRFFPRVFKNICSQVSHSRMLKVQRPSWPNPE